MFAAGGILPERINADNVKPPKDYDSWDSWADYVLGRFTRMVLKQDYWWGYFDPNECDEEQILMALAHARRKLVGAEAE